MITFHQDAEMFREALMLTRDQTGFDARLIEKDYFCTLLLEYLGTASLELVLKGGTCLAKIHSKFYRLSEDLDFMIPTETTAPRSERSRKAAPLKKALAELPRHLPCFRLAEGLTGANGSTQYVAVVGYDSLAAGRVDTIKIEIGLREPLARSAVEGHAHTILMDVVTRAPLFKPVPVRCISRLEAFAEKFRAALSRREVAVRDYFDLDFAVRNLGLKVEDAELISLVRAKLAVSGIESADVSAARLTELRRQVFSQLRPVLRTKDFTQFDMDRAFRLVADMAARVR